MLENIKLGTLLSAGFGFVLLLLAGLVWMGATVLSQTQATLDNVVNSQNVKIITVRDMQEDYQELNASLRNIIFMDNEGDMQFQKARYNEHWQDYNRLQQQLDTLLTVPRDRQLLEEIKAQSLVAMDANEKVLTPALANQNDEAAGIINTRAIPENQKWNELLGTLADSQQEASVTYAREAHENYQKASLTIAAMIAVMILAGIAVAVGIVRSVLGQLGGEPKEVATIARRIAAGELDSHIPVASGDTTSIMAAMYQVQGSLRQLVDDSLFISREATEGKLSLRADTGKHFGDYKKIIEGVNTALDSILTPLSETNRILNRISSGDLSEKMEMECRGDHQRMKEALNTLHAWLAELINFISHISKGDMTANIPPASDRDQIHPWLMLLKSRILSLVNDTKILSQAVVDGELYKTVDTSAYEGEYLKIMDSFEMAFTGLNNTFYRIVETTERVGQTVSQLNSASQNMAATSEQQSATVEEVTASLSQTEQQVKTNTQGAIAANQLVMAASEAANNGKLKMTAMMEAMGAIDQSAQNIARIIKVIDEIAFQTNLLALNAAVEAARAGQHGRGFTVVAQEVRNLAGRSARAARETADLIESSSRKVHEGVEIATHTSHSLDQIVSNVVKMKDVFAEIAAASSEQSQGITQINTAMLQVSRAALASSQQAEELAASSQELSNATQQMRTEMEHFQLREQKNRVKARRSDPEKAAGPNLPASKKRTTAEVAANLLPLDMDTRGFGSF
jgi:methyl-accepting chemotaxis protein